MFKSLFKSFTTPRNFGTIYGDELLTADSPFDVVDVGRFVPMFYEVPFPSRDTSAAQSALDFVLRYKGLPRNAVQLPTIRFMGMARLNDIMGAPNGKGNTDGVFMTSLREIWIAQQDEDKLWQMSVLVHEMTHHVQYSERDPFAPTTGEQYLEDEFDAFAVQRAWLLSQGYHGPRGVNLVRLPWSQVVEDVRKNYAPMLAAYGLTTSDQTPA